MTPLIYTTKGNLPVSELVQSVEWQEDDSAIRLIDTYKLGDEVVKQSIHVKLKQGLSMFPEQADL